MYCILDCFYRRWKVKYISELSCSLNIMWKQKYIRSTDTRECKTCTWMEQTVGTSSFTNKAWYQSIPFSSIHIFNVVTNYQLYFCVSLFSSTVQEYGILYPQNPLVLHGLQADFNPLNAELNSICNLLVLLGAQPILHISRIRVNEVVVTGTKKCNVKPAICYIYLPLQM